MSKLDVIRAWKDEEYRAGLRESELAVLASHPAGLVELLPDNLDSAGANENQGSVHGEVCTCIGICPFTQDVLCGSTMEFLMCTLLVCPPWIL